MIPPVPKSIARALAVLPALALALASHAAPVTAPTLDLSTQAVLYIVGDSTAANQTKVPTIQGWGTPFLTYFNPARIQVVNAALGGRSSRTYIGEGHLDELLAKLKPGDTVLLQWGQNDPYPLNDANGRGSLFGLGEETQEIVRSTTGQPEALHTYGWYVRKYISAIRAKGANPIILTLTVRDRWLNGKIERSASQSPPPTDARPKDPSNYSVWSAEIAQAADLPLLDVHAMIADRYDREGPAVVSTYFNSAKDPTHRNPAGAAVDASVVLACLRTWEGPVLDLVLSDAGKAVAPADPKYVIRNAPLTATDLQPFEYHGNLNGEQDSPTTPRTGEIVLGLAGDSTVNYSTGYGAGLRSHCDRRLQVIDLSRGGRTTASFRQEGRWAQMLALKPDYVMIQFGHNDEGFLPLATYSANLARFVDEARAAGIKPILVTPISRRYWGDDGKIHSELFPSVNAMKAVAAAKHVPLLDLHARAIEYYEKVGKAVTDTWSFSKPNPEYHAGTSPATVPATVLDKTHFNRVGSYAIGPVVADELKRAVPELAPYLH